MIFSGIGVLPEANLTRLFITFLLWGVFPLSTRAQNESAPPPEAQKAEQPESVLQDIPTHEKNPVAEQQPPVGPEISDHQTRSVPSPKPKQHSVPKFITVISARRSEQRAFEAPRSLAMVDHQTLNEHQAKAVPDALKESHGIFVQETNRGSGAPILRGLVGPQNLIVIDGVRFNTSTFRTGPNQYLATVDPFAIQRIEVVRGPASVLYGNGAMGGVIQIITQEPRRKKGSEVEAATWIQSADLARGGRVSLSDWHQDWGFRAGGSATGFGTLRAGEGLREPVSDYTTGSWHTKAIYTPTPALKITGAYLGTVIRNAGRVDRLGQGDLRLHDNDDHLAYLAADWLGNGILEQLRGSISYHRTFERVDRFSCARNSDGSVTDFEGCKAREETTLTRKRIFQDEVDVLGFEVNGRFSLLDRRLDLNAGGEGYFDFISSSLLDGRDSDNFQLSPSARGNFSNDSRYRTLGLYLHAEGEALRLARERARLKLSAGLRLSNFGAEAPGVPDLGKVAYDFSGVVGNVGAQFLWEDHISLYANFEQGFRAPNLQETTVLGDTGSKFEIPNDALDPERSDTVELGLKSRWKHLSTQAAWFFSRIRDAIDEEATTFQGQTEIEGKPVVRRINSAKGEYTGVEARARAEWNSLSASIGITWLKGEVTDSAGTTTPARRVPPLFGTASLRYDHPQGRAYAALIFSGAARQDRLHPSDEQDLRICEVGVHTGVRDNNCNGTPGWATVNLRAGWRFDNRWRLDLALLNLSDERYRRHGSGFLQPGLDARATLTAKF